MLSDEVLDAIALEVGQQLRRTATFGIVTATTPDLQVRLNGDTDPTTIALIMTGYTPAVDHQVVLDKVGGDWICRGPFEATS